MTGFAYLVASVLFILALRGLSSPETARRGNLYGVAGMVIAIVSTLADPGVVSLSMILLGILIGGSIGTVVGLRIKMTALPQLIAAFHSLVGMAAVFVAIDGSSLRDLLRLIFGHSSGKIRPAEIVSYSCAARACASTDANVTRFTTS